MNEQDAKRLDARQQQSHEQTGELYFKVLSSDGIRGDEKAEAMVRALFAAISVLERQIAIVAERAVVDLAHRLTSQQMATTVTETEEPVAIDIGDEDWPSVAPEIAPDRS